MTNSNELTVLIRAQDEFSQVFKNFNSLCEAMQAKAKQTAETLTAVTGVLNGNIQSLRQSYQEFNQLATVFGGQNSLSVSLPQIETGADIQNAACNLADSGVTDGIFPFDDANTALTLQNMENLKIAMQEFREFQLEGQDFSANIAATELAQSAETAQQVISDMKAVETAQSQTQAARHSMLTGFLNGMQQAQTLFGKKAFGVTKALGIAEATIGAYQSFNRTMGAYPYPVNAALAGVSLATSLMQVARIASTTSGIAHGGLDYVPKEQTYLLDRGERVLSPRQNRDLTDFLDNRRETPVVIENVIVEVLPGVTDANVLNNLDDRALRDFVEDRLLAALRDLRLAGLDY